MDYPILADNITKSFGKVMAVKNATLHSRNGVNIIIGPNGAGKSTMLRCLGGLYKPESGTVKVLGADPYENDHIRGSVSLLSDNYALYDRLSVLSNLLFFGRLYNLDDSQIRERSTAILKRLDAYQYFNRKVEELSRGTKQKIAICRALLSEPKALLLDEPTAFLDAISAEKVHRIMDELALEGKTIIYATQRLNEATRFDARLFVIRNGRMSNTTTTKDLYEKQLVNSMVTIKLSMPIPMSVAKRVPGFRKLEGSAIKITINDYKEISKALSYILKNRGYVVSVDYTENLMEGMLAD